MLDWRGLPLRLAATLAAGLPEDSRCVRRACGAAVGTATLLLARIADATALFLWRYMKPGTPKPRSVVDLLTGQAETEPPEGLRVFADGKAFELALSRFITPSTGFLKEGAKKEVNENVR